jgi:hypothetical protein
MSNEGGHSLYEILLFSLQALFLSGKTGAFQNHGRGSPNDVIKLRIKTGDVEVDLQGKYGGGEEGW